MDRSTNIFVESSGAAEAPIDYGECPICGACNRRDRTFRCKACGREFICLKHQDAQTYQCIECAQGTADDGDARVERLFTINYKLVQPWLPMGEEALVQAVISFTSQEDVALATTKIPTHLCLVLDASGSMNCENKYPLLRQAIPQLVDALSDDDYLTIILFSHSQDIVPFSPVWQIRSRVDALLRRIDESGVMFGRQTYLAPGLRAAIDEVEHFRQQNAAAVNRVYILTDGQLHDPEACYELDSRLRTLEAEVHSYGFGEDFALDTMKQLMEGIPGGTVKPIFDTRDVKTTFDHIGDLAQRIVSHEAALSFYFAPDIIAGDAFRYSPGTDYFGPVDQRSKAFQIELGALERDRVYTFAFEGRLPPSSQDRQEIGTATLRYRVQGTWEQARTKVLVDRTADTWRHRRVNKSALETYLVLEALRDDDPKVQLRALRARRAIYRREAADPVLVELVEHAIQKLERGESLSEGEKRGVRADRATVDVSVEYLVQGVLDIAVVWARDGYAEACVEWLVGLAQRLEAGGGVHATMESLPNTERQVFNLALKGENPREHLSVAELQAFEQSVLGRR